MTLKYESELLFDLMKRDGDDAPSDVLPYESELKEKYLKQIVGAYPKLQDYQPEWLYYNLYHYIPAEFPFDTVTNVTSASFNNVVPYAYGSAILNGSTKYRDIDTREVLDAFEDGRNLELVSVKMPVLTTTGKNLFDIDILKNECDEENFPYKKWKMQLKPNTTYIVNSSFTKPNNDEKIYDSYGAIINGSKYIEYFYHWGMNGKLVDRIFTTDDTGVIYLGWYKGNCPYNVWDIVEMQIEEGTQATTYEPYKSNILTVNEDVTLRGVGDVQDTLDYLTGEVTERIDEITFDGSDDEEIGIASDYGFADYVNSDYRAFRIAHSSITNKSEQLDYQTHVLMSDGYKIVDNWWTHQVTPQEGITNYYSSMFTVTILASKLEGNKDVQDFRNYIRQNPITIQYKLASPVIKTVDLNVEDKDGNKISKIKPIEGTMHLLTDGNPIKPTFSGKVPVEAITQNLMSFIEG